jgi:hypothetical protein
LSADAGSLRDLGAWEPSADIAGEGWIWVSTTPLDHILGAGSRTR